MFDNVFIVMMHVYPINNGGGPGHETKNGAAKSTVALLLLRNLGVYSVFCWIWVVPFQFRDEK